MIQTKYLFLRNDDVRESLDKELIELTEICINLQVPISHAVEPANITPEVSEWLLHVKKQNPALIEIIQHGYDHNKKNPSSKMEFGGNRSLRDQLESIRKGKELMDKYFGNQWSPVFTFPFGTFNTATLKAVDLSGYKAISAKVSYNPKSRIKDFTGKLLKQDFLAGKKVSYHGSRRLNYSFTEFSVSANLIKKYAGYNKAIHFQKHEILDQIMLSSKHTNVTGLLFHHRFHTDQFTMISELLDSLKHNYKFSTIMSLLR